jgi:hypothetical protein
MANRPAPSNRRRTPRPASMSGMPWMSERQLDAYLQTREALRRARAVASLVASVRPPPAAPPAAP